MALSPSFKLRQSQSLVMTPQLMQSIKLLQMTAGELEQFIEKALEKNPLLERSDADDSEGETDLYAESGQETGKFDLSEQIPEEKAANGQDTFETFDSETLSNMFDGADEAVSLHNRTTDRSSGRDYSSNFIGIDNWDKPATKALAIGDVNFVETIADKTNLQDFVSEQIAFAFKHKNEHDIACYLACDLDEAGYFTGSVQKVAEEFSVPEALVLKVLKHLQQFDPPGIFATSLCECLSLQLERKNRLDPAISVILENLPLLAKRDFTMLSRLSGLDESEVVDILKEIRSLDPKPGTAYSTSMAVPVAPDVIVSVDQNGEFVVELNRALMPKLVIDRDYAVKIGKGDIDRSFISDCVQNANWLIKALDQRERTLITVSAEIVRHQQEFLRRGIAALKPLTLAMVAEAVHMHESTISRVTANKYIATPRGIFEMRSFFSAALQSTNGGEQYAADAVKQRIRDLIDGENANHILSDDTLVQLLKKENIDIARRTVAKYREVMNISSSVTRRREKKAKLATTID